MESKLCFNIGRFGLLTKDNVRNILVPVKFVHSAAGDINLLAHAIASKRMEKWSW